MEDMHSLALSSLGFILTQLIQRLRYSYIGIYGFELLKTRRRTFPNKYKILNIEGKMYCHKEVKDIVYPRFLKSLTKTQQQLRSFLQRCHSGAGSWVRIWDEQPIQVEVESYFTRLLHQTPSRVSWSPAANADHMSEEWTS